MQDANCIFCKIAAGQIPARIVRRNDRALAFLDAFPLAPGHTLVIPKSHYSKVEDMVRQDSQAVFEVVQEVVGRVESAAGVDASTIVIHNGEGAGQEVMHVHVHIIPRKRDDGAGPVHSMFKKRPHLTVQEMDAILGKIAGG